MRRRLPNIAWTLGLLVTLALAGLVISTNAIGNMSGLLMEKLYIIPEETTIFEFSPTRMNTGSGDWWLYGEDKTYYYHFLGAKDIAYLTFKKSDAEKCKGFVPLDIETWCKDYLKSGRSERVDSFWNK